MVENLTLFLYMNSIQNFFKKNSEEYSSIRQINLMEESKIIRFAKDRGVPLSGTGTGDPKKFLAIDWISSDGVNESNKDLFHPFRIYPFHMAIEMCRFNISASSSINRDSFKEFLSKSCDFLPSLDFIKERVRQANDVVDLAILLEPIYWSKLTNKTTLLTSNDFEEHEYKVNAYKMRILPFIKDLDPEVWSKHHESLRMTAAKLDNNVELYLLLRTSPWAKREKIVGQIGGALWLRHIAEVIRLAFTEVHSINWPEEYEAYGIWYKGAKERIYGTENPIDNNWLTKQHLAFEFGVHTGSTIRWYLEGETEYHAASYALPEAASLGIELINLKGIFKENSKNFLRLEDNLSQDRALRRFSFISFDRDVKTNVRFLENQVKDGNVVGYINCNQPDFEFENFTLEELIEVAISIDKAQGLDTQELSTADKSNIKSGKEFEKYYSEHSETKKSLKGNLWGTCLAQYALDNPLKEKIKRPFIKTLEYALHSRIVRYEYQRDNFYIDPDDFKNKKKDCFL